MAENQDAQEKSLDPTEKRILDAQRRGDVVKSTEVGNWFMLVGATIALATFVPGLAGRSSAQFARLIEQAHTLSLSGTSAPFIATMVSRWLVELLAPTLSILVLFALTGGVIQHAPVWTAKPLAPKLSRISLPSGLKRLFSLESLFNLVKSLLKLSLVSLAFATVLWPHRDRATWLHEISLSRALEATREMVLSAMAISLTIVAVFAVSDYTYQRWRWSKKLRMSHRDVQDEMKQTVGDPIVRQRFRQIRMERAKKRMMADAATASVVITNPTHYAVALRYETGQVAPVCVAKGVDAVALRIRKVADEHDIVTVENPPLARALHDSVMLGEAIPPHHYRAVAEIIGYVMRIQARAAWRA